MADDKDRPGRARVDAELLQDVQDVIIGSALDDCEGGGDLPVADSLS